MARSGQLRVEDVQAALRLVGECRDLAYDPEQWGRHMSEGLCRLVGARASNGGEVGLVRSLGILQGATYFVAGFEPGEHDLYLEFLRIYGIDRHPLAAAFAAGRAAFTRRRVIPDREWYRSVAYGEYHRVMRIDHCLACSLESVDELHLHYPAPYCRRAGLFRTAAATVASVQRGTGSADRPRPSVGRRPLQPDPASAARSGDVTVLAGRG